MYKHSICTYSLACRHSYTWDFRVFRWLCCETTRMSRAYIIGFENWTRHTGVPGRRCQILQPPITYFCGLYKPFPVIVGLLHWVYTKFACLYLASDESFQSFQNLPGLVEGSRFKRVILSFYPRLGKDLSWR